MTTLKSLARIILHDEDTDQRIEALLAIRKSDDPRVVRLLERVEANDPDAAVRDLAHNLLVKKRLHAKTPAPIMASEPATVAIETGWTCDACGAPNPVSAMQCNACGTAYTTSYAKPQDEPSPAPSSQMASARKGAFLFNLENRDVLDGKRRLNARKEFILPLFLIPFIIVGIGIFALSGILRVQINELNANGVTTTANVTDKHIDTDTDGTDWHNVDFTFVANDTRYSESQNVDESIYRRLEVGSTVEVIYLPNNPNENRIVGTNNHDMSFFLNIFGLFWLGVTLPIFFWSLYGAMQRSALVRDGKIIIGQVVDCRGEQDSEGDYFVELKYRFESPQSGKTVDGRIREINESMRERRKPLLGTGVAIVYLNDNNHMPL